MASTNSGGGRRRGGRGLASLAIVAVATLGLSACGDDASGGGGGGGEGGDIVVALLMPTTGPVAASTEQMRDVVEMKIDALNASGGIDGRDLVLKTYDTKFEPQVAVQEAQRAITQDGADVLVGPYGSTDSLAVAEVAERSKVVMIAPSAADPGVTEGRTFVFNTQTTTEQYVGGLLAAAEKAGITKIAYLHDSGGFGASSVEVMTKLAAEAGIEIVADVEFTVNSTDMSAFVSKAAEASPEAVIGVGSSGSDYALTAKSMVEQGLDVPLIGGSPIATPDALRVGGDSYAALPQVISVQAVSKSNESYAALLAEYNEAYEPVDNLLDNSATVDAAFEWMKAGLEESGGEGSAALAEAIESVGPLDTPVGRAGSQQEFTADNHNGNSGDYLVPAVFTDGAFVEETS